MLHQQPLLSSEQHSSGEAQPTPAASLAAPYSGSAGSEHAPSAARDAAPHSSSAGSAPAPDPAAARQPAASAQHESQQHRVPKAPAAAQHEGVPFPGSAGSEQAPELPDADQPRAAAQHDSQQHSVPEAPPAAQHEGVPPQGSSSGNEPQIPRSEGTETDSDPSAGDDQPPDAEPKPQGECAELDMKQLSPKRTPRVQTQVCADLRAGL